MSPADVRRHADAMRDGIGETLRLMRSTSGRCLICGAAVGRKHERSCPTWPSIEARSAYALDTDPELPFVEETPL